MHQERSCPIGAALPDANSYISPGGGRTAQRFGYEKRAFLRFGGLKHKPPGGKAENFKNNAPDHVLVIRGLKIQVTQAVNVEFKPKTYIFSLSRNAVFSKNCKAVQKAENINLHEKSTSPKLMRLQKSTFKCAIRGSNPGHPD